MEKDLVQGRILDHLTALYGKDTALETWVRLKKLLETYQDIQTGPSPLETLQKLDALLITYADQFQVQGQPNFTSLSNFIGKYLKNHISGIHLLPFFPFSYGLMGRSAGPAGVLQLDVRCCDQPYFSRK